MTTKSHRFFKGDPFWDFCNSLIGDLSMVGDVYYYRHINTPLVIAQHRHKNILQLDFMRDVAGEFVHDGKIIRLKGTAALVFYPGVVHGFNFPPQCPAAKILGLKIRVRPEMPFVTGKMLPAIQKNPHGCISLPETLRRLYHLKSSVRENNILVVTAAMEVLALWPQKGNQIQYDALTGTDDLSDEKSPLGRTLSMIENHLANPAGISVKILSEEIGLSRRQMFRKFQNVFGVSPSEYIRGRRFTLAKETLSRNDCPITDVAASLGFPGIHQFSRWFSRMAGMPPGKFREQPHLL